MPKRSTVPAAPQPADLTPTDIGASLPRLERRLKELESVGKLSTWDENVRRELDALYTKVEDALASTFGTNSEEYRRFRLRRFDSNVPIVTGTKQPPNVWRAGYLVGIADAVSVVRTAITMLRERLEDFGETPESAALRAMDGLDLHPEIERACGDLFRDGHYSNAVGDAVKALNAYVRYRSRAENLDGSKLMQHVFGPNNPILKFNDLADESDRDEQRGFMMLFDGAVTGLRNPRAH